MVNMALAHKSLILLVLVINYTDNLLALPAEWLMTYGSTLAQGREDTDKPNRGSPLNTIAFVASTLSILMLLTVGCACKKKEKTKPLENDLEAQIEETETERMRGRFRNSARSPANKLKTIRKGSVLGPAIYKPSSLNKERLARLREEAVMSASPSQASRSLASATLTSDITSIGEQSMTVQTQQGLASLTANSQMGSIDMGSVACETVRSFADPPEPPSPKTPPKKSSGKKKQSKKHRK